MDKAAFDLKGAEELQRLLRSMPNNVQKRATLRGLRRAAAKLRTLIRRDAPRETGLLRRSIGIKKLRNGAFDVGLMQNYYYKVLDLVSAKGRPLKPWFEQSVNRHSRHASKLIMEETEKAIYYEAGKIHARTMRNKRG